MDIVRDAQDTIKEESMTVITMAAPSPAADTQGCGVSVAADGGIAGRIAQLQKAIAGLQKQLGKLADAPLPLEEKRRQQEMIQDQIKMLLAEIARLRQQASEAQQRAGSIPAVNSVAQTRRGDGVNRPQAERVLDVYI